MSGDQSDERALISALAQQAIALATMTPMAEAKTASPGQAVTASRGDHVHPRLTSTANGTLNSSGEATIVFTRTFATKPSVLVTLVEEAENQPVVFKVKSRTRDGVTADYLGCVSKGYRSLPLPQLVQVSGLLTAVITGVNVIVGALTSYNIFAGSASGAEYTLIALQSSAS